MITILTFYVAYENIGPKGALLLHGYREALVSTVAFTTALKFWIFFAMMVESMTVESRNHNPWWNHQNLNIQSCTVTTAVGRTPVDTFGDYFKQLHFAWGSHEYF